VVFAKTAEEAELYGNDWKFNPAKDVDMRGTGNYLEALNEAFKRTGVSKSEFEVVEWGKNIYGKSVPVEYSGPRGANVNLDIPKFNNIDDYGNLKEGPFEPHIGYRTQKGSKINGHIFVDGIPATRFKPKEKK